MDLDELLGAARVRLHRLSPAAAAAALHAGDAVLVDIRGDEQIARDGRVPGAVRIARNVLEWRAAPSSTYRDERVCDPDRILILMCDEGYQSSLAAATLQDLGLPRATDLEGGFQAWRREGRPVEIIP